MIGVSSGGGLLPRLGEHRRETHYCSSWNAGCDCPRSKFALVFAVFGNGRLPTLRLRHLSTMSCRSPSQERILHSKLHIPAIIAGHSAALARLLSPILLGFRSGNFAIFAAIRRALTCELTVCASATKPTALGRYRQSPRLGSPATVAPPKARSFAPPMRPSSHCRSPLSDRRRRVSQTV